MYNQAYICLGTSGQRLGGRWRRLGGRWHRLGGRWHRLGGRWHRLGYSWRGQCGAGQAAGHRPHVPKPFMVLDDTVINRSSRPISIQACWAWFIP